jgi:hypothetical protein
MASSTGKALVSVTVRTSISLTLMTVADRRCRDHGPVSLLLHQRGDVLGRVIFTGDAGQVATGRDAVVVVVAVSDENGVQAGTSSALIGNSIITCMSNPPNSGSTISVVPRLLIRSPAMPSH